MKLTDYHTNKLNKNKRECPGMVERILQDDFTTAATVKVGPGEAFGVLSPGPADNLAQTCSHWTLMRSDL